MKMNQKMLFAASMLALASASQAAVDTTALVTEIGSAGTAVAAIGAAVLLVFVGIKLYKWVRGAM